MISLVLRRTAPWLFVFTVLYVSLPATYADDEPAVKGAEESETSGEPSEKDESSADPEAQPDAAEESPAEAAPEAADEEFYELIKLFSDTLDQVERNYVEEISRRELMEAAIRGVLGKLDQYSNYIPPDDLDSFKTGVENQFGGIGIRVRMQDDKLTIITPLIGTPAYEAGVLANDHIVKIGSEDTAGMSLEEAIKKMKGVINSTIEISVRHAHNEEVETFELVREMVQLETVLGDHRNDDDSWDFMCDEDAKIAYIRLTSFSRRTHRDLRRVIQQLSNRGLKGLILDLRFNPGGLLTSAVEVADLFLDDGTIVSTEGRNTPSRKWTAKKSGTFNEFEMVVLVNRYSASASEIVAACLQDHDRATIIGERTWGKGSVQNIIELEGGRSALKLTTAGYLRPSGKNIHRFEGAQDKDDWGVLPEDTHRIRFSTKEMNDLLTFQQETDVVARRQGEEEAEESDPSFVDRQLEKALELLQSEVASR
ncbi:MAG: S41 family peptidase [Planctomycetaceae bacterium]|nr:S41 family peptidase [Planctomycetaceae bacterium]